MKQMDYVVHREGEFFVAQCLDVDVSGFGSTREEAAANLKEAVELYFEDEPAGAFTPVADATVGRELVNAQAARLSGRHPAVRPDCIMRPRMPTRLWTIGYNVPNWNTGFCVLCSAIPQNRQISTRILVGHKKAQRAQRG